MENLENSNQIKTEAAKKILFKKLKSSATQNQELVDDKNFGKDSFWCNPISHFFKNQIESAEFISGLTERMDEHKANNHYSLGNLVSKLLDCAKQELLANPR